MRQFNTYLLFIVLTVFVCATIGAAQNSIGSQIDDEAAIRRLSTQFYYDFEKATLDDQFTRWSPRSTDKSAQKDVMTKLFAEWGKLKVEKFNIDQVKIQSETASVRLTVHLSGVPKPDRPLPEWINREAKFTQKMVKEGGVWLLLWQIKTADDLALEILDIKSGKEPATLFAENKNLVDREFMAALAGQAALLSTLKFYNPNALKSGCPFCQGKEVDLDYDRALTALRLALPLAENLNDTENVPVIRQTIGQIRSFRLPSKVIQAQTEAEAEALLAENKDLITSSFVTDLEVSALSMANNDFDYPRALRVLRLSLRLAEGLKDKQLIGQTVSFMAPLYMRLGDHALALMADQRYLQLMEESGNVSAVSNARNSLGVDYALLGNNERALELFLKSGISLSGSNIGQTYLGLGKLPEARQAFEKLRIESESKNNKDGVSRAFLGFGDIHRVEGNYSAALESYLKALQLSKESKDQGVVQFMRKRIGEIYLLLGKYAEALKNAEEAARLAEEMKIKDLGWDAQVTAGRAYLALKQFEPARAAFEDAIRTIEKMRDRNLGNEESQQRFFENKSTPYQGMIELLVSQNKADEAFAFAEKSKARVLLSLLTGGRNNVTKSMTEAETREELKLAAKLAEANRLFEQENRKAEADSKQLAQLRDQLEKARLEYESFRSQLYLNHPELQVQRGEMEPIPLKETASLLRDPNSAIAEYVVADDKTFLFIITKNISGQVSLQIFEIKIRNKDLATQVESFRSKVATGDLDFQKPARDLYDLLLKPARAELSGKTRLTIVPDGVLWDLPFQALRDEKNQYLIEQASISYAPSLTVLREMSKKGGSKKPSSNLQLLAFGNPVIGPETSNRIKQVLMSEALKPLPESERLVKDLGKMYGAASSRIFTGKEAREEIAKVESAKYRIIQFATHGILNNTWPMYSHLVLSRDEKNPDEDGLLEAWEMKDLDLHAEMVILSACETARGRISNGEGVIGMSWAMFIAGAPTTVASQWKVESSSTTDLMLEFHQQLLANKNIGKAEALRQASLKLLKTTKYKHPSYWAGFVMVGDGS